MATITGYTASYMKGISDKTVVSGAVDGSGHLQLKTRDNTAIDAGSVIGPQGQKGDQGQPGAAGVGLPTGGMLDWAGGNPPSGYLACDGSSLAQTDYPNLYNAIGAKYGQVDSSHFNLPDNTGARLLSTATNSLSTTFGRVGGWTPDTSSGYGNKLGRYYSALSSGGDFTILTPDDYDIYAQITFASSSSTGSYGVGIFKNNTEMARLNISRSSNSQPITVPIARAERLAVNDIIAIYAMSSSPSLSGTTLAHILELRPRGIRDIIKT